MAGALLHPSGVDAFFEEFSDPAFDTSPQMKRWEWAAQLFACLFLALLIVGVAALRAGRRFGALLALNFSFPAKVSWIAFGITAAIMIAETVAEELYPPLLELVQSYISLPSDPGALWIAGFAIVLGAPVVEEFLFRGFLYTSFRAKWGYVPALVATSVLFSILHFEDTGIYALLILPSAFLLGWMRERSGGIALPIATHAFMNLGAFLTQLYRGV